MSAAEPTARPARRRISRRRLGVILAGAVVGLGIWWWFDGGRDLFFPKNWGVVEEGLVYRSGRIHRRIVKDVLAEHDIRVVVDLAGTDEADPNFAPEREAARALDIELTTFRHLDGYGLGSMDDYVQAFAILLRTRREKRPILVHCGGGSERTGAIFAWYRMLVDGWDGARAYDEDLHYRHKEPDSPALQAFVNRGTTKIIEAMRAEHLLDAVPDPLPVFGPAGSTRP